MNPNRMIWDREVAERQLNFFDRLRMAFRDSPDPRDHDSLGRVNSTIERTKELLKPDLLERLGNYLVRTFKRPMIEFTVYGASNRSLFLPTRWAPHGLSGRQMQEKDRDIDRLSMDLHKLGLPDEISAHAQTQVFYDAKSLVLQGKTYYAGTTADVETRVERSDLTGRYYPVSYDLTTYPNMQPKGGNVAGINIEDLDLRMSAINWEADFTKASTHTHPDFAPDHALMLRTASDIFRDLNRLLAEGSAQARDEHHKLAAKHFSGTPNAGLVPDLEAFRQRYAERIHVDVTMKSEHLLKAQEAIVLLNNGSVSLAKDPAGQGQPWLRLNKERDANGYRRVEPVPRSENFGLHAALAEANVLTLDRDMGEADALKALASGNSVRAEILQPGNGLVSRYIYANPTTGKIAIDWMRSAAHNLFQQDGQLQQSVSDYAESNLRNVQANSLQPDNNRAATSSRQEASPVVGHTLFGEFKRAAPENGIANEAALERQLLEMGFPPTIAKEALRQVYDSGQPEIRIPDTQNFSGNIVLSQLRFVKDPEQQWVHFKGYDINVDLATQQQQVNQRFYYNPDNPANNFSLQEAYNMASGRPVSRSVVGQDGLREMWYQMAMDRPLTPAGNHHIVASEFDLRRALEDYPQRGEFERALPAGVTIDGLIGKARLGDPVQFPLNIHGRQDQHVLQVDPTQKGFSILRAGAETATVKQAASNGQQAAQAIEDESKSVDHTRSIR